MVLDRLVLVVLLFGFNTAVRVVAVEALALSLPPGPNIAAAVPLGLELFTVLPAAACHYWVLDFFGLGCNCSALPLRRGSILPFGSELPFFPRSDSFSPSNSAIRASIDLLIRIMSQSGDERAIRLGRQRSEYRRFRIFVDKDSGLLP